MSFMDECARETIEGWNRDRSVLECVVKHFERNPVHAKDEKSIKHYEKMVEIGVMRRIDGFPDHYIISTEGTQLYYCLMDAVDQKYPIKDTN